MRKQTILVAILFCAAIYGFGIAESFAANPADDPFSHCTDLGLTGAEFGMCTAAIAVGCDIPENGGHPECIRIANNYQRITGVPPQWDINWLNVSE